jgi:hypothetical protein
MLSLGAEKIHVDWRIDRPEKSNSRFSHFAKATKKGLVPQVAWTTGSSYCRRTVFFVKYEKTHNCVVHVHATLQILENYGVIIWTTLFANSMNCNKLLKNDVTFVLWPSICDPPVNVLRILQNWETRKGVKEQANFCEPTVQSKGIWVLCDCRLWFKVSRSTGNLELVKFNITVTMIRNETLLFFNRHYQRVT